MAKGKGMGPLPIIAVATVSAAVTIVLDHFGITTWVQNWIKGLVKHAS